MGNYVIGVGNYVIVNPSELGNYKIADTPAYCGLEPNSESEVALPRAGAGSAGSRCRHDEPP
jgi:hypothetical protein